MTILRGAWPGQEGYTPVYWAASKGMKDSVRLLLAAKAAIDSADKVRM